MDKKYLAIGDDCTYATGETLKESYTNMQAASSYSIDEEDVRFFELKEVKVKFDIIELTDNQ